MIRRKRKILEIAVEPDLTVSVVASLSTNIASIESKVKNLTIWIPKQKRYFCVPESRNHTAPASPSP